MSEVGNAQVPVFPTFKGFRSEVTSEVSQAAKAGGKAFASMFKAASATTAPDLTKTKRALADATRTWARTRMAQADATGRVRVAESQLADAIAKTGTESTRTIQAQERLASAQRAMERASEDATDAVHRLKSAQASAAAAAAAGAAGARNYARGWAGLRARLTDTLRGAVRSASLSAATAARTGGSNMAGALLGGLKNAAIGAGVAVLALGGLAVKAGIETAAGMEQAEISFTTMLGSGKRAKAFIADLSRFAAETPFEFTELQSAAGSLISAGIDAKKVIPIMRTLGDVTSGMGTGSEGVQRATIAIQQMNAAGRITGEDLNQLRDAGIPVYDLLAKATGKSKAEVVKLAQAGKLGKKELGQMMKALETGKGLERFTGLMDKQSQSMAGVFSTLKDNVMQGLAGAIKPIEPLLKEGLAGAARAVATVMPQVKAGMQGFMDFLKANPAVIKGFNAALALAGQALQGLGWVIVNIIAPALGWLLEAVVSNIRGIAALVRAMSYLPGMQALRTAADNLDVMADGVAAVAQGLRDLPKMVTPQVAVRDQASPEITKIDTKMKSLKDRLVTAKAKSDTKEVDHLRNAIAKLKDKKVKIWVSAETNKSKDEIAYSVKGHGSLKFTARAGGGPIGGIGTSTSDSNLIAASRGEYMFRALAARRIGIKAMEFMNRTGQLVTQPVVVEGGGGSSAPTIIHGNVYGDHYLNQISRRKATASRHMMQREGIPT